MKTVAMTIAAAALLTAACAGGGSDGAAAARPSSTAPAGTGAAPQSPGAGRLRSLPPQLRFEGTTLQGRPFTGSDLAERPVVFWFWAPWCPKCISEAPHVAEVAKKYGDRVAFVGIAGLDKSKTEMQRFVTRTGTGDITQLDDRTGNLYAHFKVTTQSSFLFMTRDGRTTSDSGPLGVAELERHVRTIAGG